MGGRLSYEDDMFSRKEDANKLVTCQDEILFCTPNFCCVNFPEINDMRIYYEGIKDEIVEKAFKTQKMKTLYYLDILKICGFAYNEPSLQELIASLIQNKIFFSLSEKGYIKRKKSKEIVDNALKKVLLTNLPQELHCLVKDNYFIEYINELYLPLSKDKIVGSVGKYFELCDLKPEILNKNYDFELEEFQGIRRKIKNYKLKFQDIVDKFKKENNLQTKEIADFAKKKECNIDDKTFETYNGLI